jgi:hypothetical protein
MSLETVSLAIFAVMGLLLLGMGGRGTSSLGPSGPVPLGARDFWKL